MNLLSIKKCQLFFTWDTQNYELIFLDNKIAKIRFNFSDNNSLNDFEILKNELSAKSILIPTCNKKVSTNNIYMSCEWLDAESETMMMLHWSKVKLPNDTSPTESISLVIANVKLMNAGARVYEKAKVGTLNNRSKDM